MRHFHEKLREEHEIELSYTLGAEGAARGGAGGQAAQAGPAPAAAGAAADAGMLLHIDGSKHRWCNDERWYDLIVILDDATSEIYYAQLVEEESTRTVMAGLREVIETKGLFCALYSDRGSHFFVTRKGWREGGQAPVDAGGASDEGAGGADDRGLFAAGARPVGAELRDLAGAACRRNCGWRGSRRWRGPIGFLREHYIAEFNGKFSVAAAEKGTAFRRTSRADLDWIFTHADRAHGGQGQHGGDREPLLADRQDALPPHAGRADGDNPRASGRDGVDPLRARTWWAATTRRAKADRAKAKSAVEKAGAWKPGKTKSRFPPAPTLPWKSRRRREIPTFPPRRQRLLLSKEAKAKTKPRRRPKAASLCFTKRTDHVLIKPDNLTCYRQPEMDLGVRTRVRGRIASLPPVSCYAFARMRFAAWIGLTGLLAAQDLSDCSFGSRKRQV